MEISGLCAGAIGAKYSFDIIAEHYNNALVVPFATLINPSFNAAAIKGNRGSNAAASAEVLATTTS